MAFRSWSSGLFLAAALQLGISGCSTPDRLPAVPQTAAAMAVTTVMATGVGMLLAYAAARRSGVHWRWPGWDLAALLGGGVLAALLFSAIALPLLSLTTRHDAVRFE